MHFETRGQSPWPINNRTNYHGQLVDDSFPFPGIAVAPSVNFKTAQTVLIPAPHTRKFALARIALISALVASVSNGATVVVTERDTAVKTAATLSTTMTGANNDIVLTAVTKGTVGNAIKLTLVDPAGNDQALSVVVTGNGIVVNLATGVAGAITTTASQLIAALAANADAAALVTAALKGSDTGATAVTALAETALAGGLEWTVVQTVVASADLADTDATGLSQILTIATGAAPIQPGNQIAIAITAGTATTDLKDILIEGTVY